MHKEEDHAALEAQYRPAADKGDAEAQFELAKMYNSCYCPGLEKRKESKTEALRWFRKAAEHGHVEAQYRTGLYYRHGLQVVAKDQAEGDFWFLKAAEQGHTGAMMALGRYREAAELGDAYAQCRLGEKYEEGDGVPQDEAEAMAWYLKAANNTNTDYVDINNPSGKAAYAIGKMYADGRGVPKDTATALAWYFKAAEMRSEEASYEISSRYARGIGVPKDTAVAAEWYVEAESRGQDFDWYDLKEICKARGIPLKEMLAAYSRAAETSDAWAMELRNLYKYGYGVVSPDEAESQKWLRKAALEFRGHLEDVNTEGGTH